MRIIQAKLCPSIRCATHASQACLHFCASRLVRPCRCPATIPWSPSASCDAGDGRKSSGWGPGDGRQGCTKDVQLGPLSAVRALLTTGADASAGTRPQGPGKASHGSNLESNEVVKVSCSPVASPAICVPWSRAGIGTASLGARCSSIPQVQVAIFKKTASGHGTWAGSES